jgi:hypothetical protein
MMRLHDVPVPLMLKVLSVVVGAGALVVVVVVSDWYFLTYYCIFLFKLM